MRTTPSANMHAAVIRAFGQPPQYEAFDLPTPANEHETLVSVIAAGLHPRVRSQAGGTHYTSTGTLPLIPGIDGIGRLPDGTLVYFILPDTNLGAMADYTVVDRRRSVALPAGTDPLVIAAGMNPAMSSWLALRQRIAFRPGQSVLVLGATGNAGQMAVQIAKYFGAGQVIAAGRDPQRLAALPALGADVTVALDGAPDDVAGRLAAAASEVDVVLDYLWGAPTELAIRALIPARADEGRLLAWIQVGSVAGLTTALPSAALRAANLNVMGSGQGSVSTAAIVAELPALAQALAGGAFAVNAVATPLAEVATTWTAPVTNNQRIVIFPDARLMPRP